MKVLLTGAAGRLGRVLRKHLERAGMDIRATDCMKVDDRDGDLVVCDLLDASAVEALVTGVSAVVHLANHSNAGKAPPMRLFNDNVAMNMNVFHAATSAGVRTILYASSVQAMTGHRLWKTGQEQPSELPYLPLDGDLPHRPATTYGLSKCVAEDQLRYCVEIMGLPSGVTMRFPLLIDRSSFQHWRGIESRPEHVHPDTPIDECFSWLSTDDASRLVRAGLAADLRGYRCWFPANPRPRLRASAAEIAARYFANVPWKPKRAARESLVNISTITAETGWVPQDDFWKELERASAFTLSDANLRAPGDPSGTPTRCLRLWHMRHQPFTTSSPATTRQANLPR